MGVNANATAFISSFGATALSATLDAGPAGCPGTRLMVTFGTHDFIGSGPTISSVTVNSTANMTLAVNDDPAGFEYHRIYYYDGLTGSVTVTVTFSATTTLDLICASFGGVDTSQTMVTGAASANGTSVTATVSTFNPQDAVFDHAEIVHNSVNTPRTRVLKTQYLIRDISYQFDVSNRYSGTSSYTKDGGPQDLGYTLGAARDWRLIYAVIPHQFFGATIMGRP
jgi:hypothetical protein